MAIVAVVWLGLDRNAAAMCAGEGVCLDLFLNTEAWLADLLWGLAAAALVLFSWEAVRRLLPLARQMELELERLVGTLQPDEAIALALLSGFAEELLFRGAVQGSLGLPLATLAFALLHTGPGKALKLWTLYAGVVGLLLALLMEWRGNLLAPVVAHVAINAFGLTRLALRGSGEPLHQAAFSDRGSSAKVGGEGEDDSENRESSEDEGRSW